MLTFQTLKRLAAATVCLLAMIPLKAVPAWPHPITLNQPDGTTIGARIVGDEYYSFFTTADGYTLTRNAQGYYTYAAIDTSGKLTASRFVAHNPAHRSTQETQWLASTRRHLTDRNAVNNALRHRRLTRQAMLRPRRLSTDNFKGLVLLVQWNDTQFQRSDAKEFYNRMLNERGYQGFTNEDGTPNEYGQFTGSVRDYFIDNTRGLLDPTFDIVGPITVPYSVDSPEKMANIYYPLSTALRAAKDSVDLRKYDTDYDGRIDMFYVIFAGVGSNTGEEGAENHVWPHAGFHEMSTSLNGVESGHYACSCEFLLSDVYDGIGTICHEFSHLWDIQDLYDTNYEEQGLSHHPATWDIMAYGSYNDLCRTPAGFSAYDRYAMGFGTPQLITEPGKYSLRDIQSSGEAFIIQSAVEGEKFLLENRQPTRWDTSLAGHGLIIARMDSTSRTPWVWNTINADSTHNYYELLRAGGQAQPELDEEEDRDSDPFPGSLNRTHISNDTKPHLRSWTGKRTPLFIDNITETADGIITFNVGKEKADTMTMTEDFELMPTTTDLMADSVQGRWAKWKFIQCRVVDTGDGLGNGLHAVAMTMPSAFNMVTTITSQITEVTAMAYNPTGTTAKFALSYSTDNGKTWKNASGSNNSVAAHQNQMLSWPLKMENDNTLQLRVTQSSGSKTETCYLDDVTVRYVNYITHQPTPLTGDVNADGRVDVEDVNAVINIILKIASDELQAAGDVNGDNRVDVEDVNAIINIILKL